MDGARKERRGFASMSREKQREIASKGGRAAHEKGTAHEWTPDEARAAGRKGGSPASLALPGLPPAPGSGDESDAACPTGDEVLGRETSDALVVDAHPGL